MKRRARKRGIDLTESDVRKAVFKMGLSPRHKGFYYISREIFGQLKEDPGCVLRVCGEKSELVRKRIERCMRYAIRYAWDVNEGEIRRLFPNSRIPPSPCEFISVMLWEMDDEK